MTHLTDANEALGALSVVLALIAAIVYLSQTLAGQVRPHPLSWTLFGVLSGTGFLVQRAEGARAGSWALLTMTASASSSPLSAWRKESGAFPRENGCFWPRDARFS